MRFRRILALIACLLCLTGCAQTEAPRHFLCRVVLEEEKGFSCADYTQTVEPGADASFYFTCDDGYTVTGTDYGSYTLSAVQGGGMMLTLQNVRYSTVVTLTVEKSDVSIFYHPNGAEGELTEVPVTPSHLRWNTATSLFQREGYTLTGWNTQPDGSGISVGLGSRTEPINGQTLYAQWSQWSDPALFQWRTDAGGITITAYLGNETTVTVPAELDGQAVRTIAAGAFEGVPCETVILPDTLYTLEDEAFRDCGLSTLYLFDNIRSLSDRTFHGCENLATLHLNAVEPPVYSGTYYDTFQDKFDWLVSLQSEKKIVLFSGSSSRFGYDSEKLREAFPAYEIVNMGVFAYTNAMPQLDLILPCMNEGDILLHSPEFDAAKRQFCTSANLDEPFFNMMESNYDTIALLDLRQYSLVFTPLAMYLSTRSAMEKKSYALSASGFDEDGNPVASPSYNKYGDYIVYRPNAASDLPLYGLPVSYTVTTFPKDPFITSINQMYQRFLDKGVRVYYTYSPRNSLAISEDSTPDARAELDAYLRQNLCVPIITELEDSLWPGTYLYGTDNHLSTEGVAIHTARIIAALNAQFAMEETP